MLENLTRYRKNMMEYRENILKLYSDKTVNKKNFNLTKFFYFSLKKKHLKYLDQTKNRNNPKTYLWKQNT